MKPEPLLNYSNPSHILYGNKPPLLGGVLKPIPLEQFEKTEKIIWINSPVAYRNTLLFLSKTPDIYDESLICEFNDFAICEINSTVGKGVFATHPIKANTLIGIYAGILDLALGRYSTAYGLYCTVDSDFFYYDSLRYRNITGYIQHAPSHSLMNIAIANIKPEAIIQRGIPVSCFITTQDIAAGEQLLLDYGEYYWEEKPFQLFDKKGQIISSAVSNSQQ
ncbi:MAG TPA: SET domain-containing protein-lysine N-methyltransferase [Gammaproteobacteria bacterium]|nr:SET domain-containing protein-lysine N-methyltransferase [Gammaproteobacteria bacterium]